MQQCIYCQGIYQLHESDASVPESLCSSQCEKGFQKHQEQLEKELEVNQSNNACDFCRYEFNKNYETKCPCCGEPVAKPECQHSAISLTKGFPHCLDCNTDFKNGELGEIRKERENNCDHSNLEPGWYASNPPKKRCLDCGGYFTKDQLEDKLFTVVCTETCKGDNGFIFKQGKQYQCVVKNMTVSIIKDDDGNNHIFYRNEYKSLFKPINERSEGIIKP